MTAEVKKEDIYGMPYYKCKQPFYGSLEKMRYRITKISVPIEEGSEETKDLLETSIWLEDVCYQVANKDSMIINTFEFSENGLEEVVNYLNEYYQNKVMKK